MNAYPAPHSFLVLNNATIHHGRRIEALCQKKGWLFAWLSLIGASLTSMPCLEPVGIRLQYLPAYSPELNPIETAFSVLKAGLRRL